MAIIDTLTQKVNILPTGIPTPVHLSQSENGRTLSFEIIGGSGELPAGSVVTLTGTKPDGVVYSAVGTLSGNIATFEEDVQLTAAAGVWPAKIEVTNGGHMIATGRISFTIDADPVAPGSVPSESELDGLVAQAAMYAENARSAAYGSPLTAATAADMIDTTRVYVYTGNETGMENGHWYYWEDGAWKDGGIYNAAAVQTDTSLSIPGMAADAKATGEAIAAEAAAREQADTALQTAIDTKADTSALTAETAAREQADADLKSDLRYISDSENLFGNTSGEILESTITAAGYLIFGAGGKVVIIECQPNTMYKLSKKAGGKFTVGDLDHFPADRDQCAKYYADNTASTIYYQTSTTAKYLVAFVYYNATDGFDYSSMLSSVVIQAVSAKDAIARAEVEKKVDTTYGYDPLTETEYSAGVMNKAGSLLTGDASFRHCYFNIQEETTYKVYTPQVFNQPGFPVYIFYDINSTIITYGPSDATKGGSYTGEVTSPTGAVRMLVNCNSSAKGTVSEKVKLTLSEAIAEGVVNYKKEQYKNKTIIFFGTSIVMPSAHSIPTYIGDILGCNIVNQAKGSSCARRGWNNKISANDEYGWTGVAWQNVFRAMGANLTEKQDLIDNYETKWRDLLGGNSDGSEGDGSGSVKPTTLSANNIAEIRACSYENLLIPYLDGTEDMPDLFVFEHGRNDVDSWYGGNDSDFVGTVENENSLNRSKYGDVMYFYIKKIFEANPQAKVLIMSYYEHDSAKGEVIVPAQKQLAEYHGVYFCDVSNAVAWSQRKVTTTGYWDENHIWVNSGGLQQTITRRQQALYDNLHPHSDYSGKASMRVAEIVARYIDSNIIL